MATLRKRLGSQSPTSADTNVGENVALVDSFMAICRFFQAKDCQIEKYALYLQRF
jgi:hypothetical protein